MSAYLNGQQVGNNLTAYLGSQQVLPAIPAPALALPLQGSLLPSAGTGTLTHTRATSAWMWRDSDGRMWRDYAAGRVLIECPAGELRVEGARRVRNLFGNSSLSNSSVFSVANSGLRTFSTPGSLPIGSVGCTRLEVNSGQTGTYLYIPSGTPCAPGAILLASVYGFAATGQPDLRLTAWSASWATRGVVSSSVKNEWVKLSLTVQMSGGDTGVIIGIGPATLAASGNYHFYTLASLVDITGLTDQSAPEYISTGVLSYPFHGAGADGVKYYSTLADGTPIPANEIKTVTETAVTNLLLNSATLSTQNVTVTAQPYTLSFRGTGSVTLSGTATGTLTGTGEHNRVQLTFTPTAGTLTLTVSGTVTTAVLRAGTTAGTYIPTTSATVTRNADALTLTNYTLPASGTLYFEAEARDWAQVGGQLFGDGTDSLLSPRQKFTNLLTYSEDFSNAAWTKHATITITKSGTESLLEMTASANNIVSQRVTMAASRAPLIGITLRSPSGSQYIYAHIRDGGNTVNYGQHVLVTGTGVTVFFKWPDANGIAIANPYIYLSPSDGTNRVTQTRSLYVSAPMFLDVTNQSPQTIAPYIATTSATASLTTSGIVGFDGTNLALGPEGAPSGTMRFAVRWNSASGKMKLAANGKIGTEANYDGNWDLASYILAGGFDGAICNLRTYDRALTDSQMRRLTA